MRERNSGKTRTFEIQGRRIVIAASTELYDEARNQPLVDAVREFYRQNGYSGWHSVTVTKCQRKSDPSAQRVESIVSTSRGDLHVFSML